MKRLALVLLMLSSSLHAGSGFAAGLFAGGLFGGHRTRVIKPLPLQNAEAIMDDLLRIVVNQDMKDKGLTSPIDKYEYYQSSGHEETLVQDNAQEQQALVMSRIRRLIGWDAKTNEKIFEYKTIYVIMETNVEEHYQVQATCEAAEMRKLIQKRGFKISLKAVI